MADCCRGKFRHRIVGFDAMNPGLLAFTDATTLAAVAIGTDDSNARWIATQPPRLWVKR